MKILVYGSTYLTKVAVDLLKDRFDLVGYIPSRNPTVRGEINLPLVPETVEHDIKLSLGYDQRILEFHNAYNIHPGILPEYGGCDILFHTLKNKEQYQGLTFHKMVHDFDAGPVIAKTTYPVVPTDTVMSLYERVARIYPGFALYCLELLQDIDHSSISDLPTHKPIIYKRGQIAPEYREEYDNNLLLLRKFEREHL